MAEWLGAGVGIGGAGEAVALRVALGTGVGGATVAEGRSAVAVPATTGRRVLVAKGRAGVAVRRGAKTLIANKPPPVTALAVISKTRGTANQYQPRNAGRVCGATGVAAVGEAGPACG